MKKRKVFLMIALLCVAATLKAQSHITLEPLFKLGIYSGRNEHIGNPNTGRTYEIYTPPSTGEYKMHSLHHQLSSNIDYYIISGLRLNFRGFVAESENKIRIATNNFIENTPYAAEFYLRAYYKHKKIKIGWEHLCLHPIKSEMIGNTYQIRGGYNEFFISFNL